MQGAFSPGGAQSQDVLPAEDLALLAELCVACVEKVKAAVGMLSNMDNAEAIMRVCEDIDRLESEADHVMRAAMAKSRSTVQP